MSIDPTSNDKERLTRFGFRYLETLLEQAGRRIEVVNLADFLPKSLITS
jgi:predicted site-specific integrase-resolvase